MVTTMRDAISMTAGLNRDLARALRTHGYERVPDGRVYVPGAKVFMGGVFTTDVNGLDRRMSPNRVVAEGLDDLLKVYFKQAAQRTAFYLAPFSGNVEVTDDLTAATFASTQTEFTDYSAAQRPTWTPGNVTSGEVSNSANVGSITVSTAGGSVWGWGMLTASAKSATTGVLVAATKDDDARGPLKIGDKLNVDYGFVATDASDA